MTFSNGSALVSFLCSITVELTFENSCKINDLKAKNRKLESEDSSLAAQARRERQEKAQERQRMLQAEDMKEGATRSAAAAGRNLCVTCTYICNVISNMKFSKVSSSVIGSRKRTCALTLKNFLQLQHRLARAQRLRRQRLRVPAPLSTP